MIGETTLKNRPISISIIAISQGIIASVYILYNLIVWGFNLYILLMNIALLAFILLASFWLWKGREWGWWLTNIYYFKMLFGMIVSTVNLLYFIPRKYEHIEVGITNTISTLGTTALTFGLLIPILLLRRNILNYFKISNYKSKFLLIMIIAIIWYFAY